MEIEDVAISTAGQALAIAQSGAALMAVGMIMTSGVRWSSPSGAFNDLKDEVLHKGPEMPVTTALMIIAGLLTGVPNSYSPPLLAGYGGFVGGIAAGATSIWGVDMITHYTGAKLRTSEQMWAHISTGALICGVTAGTSAALISTFG